MLMYFYVILRIHMIYLICKKLFQVVRIEYWSLSFYFDIDVAVGKERCDCFFVSTWSNNSDSFAWRNRVMKSTRTLHFYFYLLSKCITITVLKITTKNKTKKTRPLTIIYRTIILLTPSQLITSFQKSREKFN